MGKNARLLVNNTPTCSHTTSTSTLAVKICGKQNSTLLVFRSPRSQSQLPIQPLAITHFRSRYKHTFPLTTQQGPTPRSSTTDQLPLDIHGSPRSQTPSTSVTSGKTTRRRLYVHSPPAARFAWYAMWQELVARLRSTHDAEVRHEGDCFEESALGRQLAEAGSCPGRSVSDESRRSEFAGVGLLWMRVLLSVLLSTSTVQCIRPS